MLLCCTEMCRVHIIAGIGDLAAETQSVAAILGCDAVLCGTDTMRDAIKPKLSEFMSATFKAAKHRIKASQVSVLCCWLGCRGQLSELLVCDVSCLHSSQLRGLGPVRGQGPAMKTNLMPIQTMACRWQFVTWDCLITWLLRTARFQLQRIQRKVSSRV